MGTLRSCTDRAKCRESDVRRLRKNVTSYLEAYRAEMIMRDILEDRRLSWFPRVVALSIHTKMLEV